VTSPGSGSAYTPISVRAFDNAVQLIEQLIAKLRTELNNLIDRINAFISNVQQELEDSWLDSVFEFFTDDISDGLSAIRRLLEVAKSKVGELLEKAEKSVAGSIPVASLFSRAFDLGDRINRPLTGMYGDMTGSGEIDFWRGPAKFTYEKRVGDQQQAITNASDKVESLATYLGEAATANMTYMSELGARMGEVYGSVTTTCVDLVAAGAGAITQVMDALGHFSEVIGTVVNQIVGYITALGARIAEVLNQIVALETEKSDLTGLTPEGRWPAPVAS
jgi:methyl-accepting chemotaxis protein